MNVDDDGNPVNNLYLEFQPWSLNGFCKEDFNKNGFWSNIIEKLKSYLIAQESIH